MKRNGLFKIIESIKETYGQDLAIISCEELNKNCKGNCKKLVTEYMSPYVHQGPNLHSDGLPKQEEEDLKLDDISTSEKEKTIENEKKENVIKNKISQYENVTQNYMRRRGRGNYSRRGNNNFSRRGRGNRRRNNYYEDNFNNSY